MAEAALSLTPKAHAITLDSQLVATPEYLTIVRCYQMLVDVLKQSVNSIVSALFAKGYISENIRDKTRLDLVTPSDKITIVLDCLTDRIKHEPKAYHQFVEILEEMRPWTDLVLESLSKRFQDYVNKSSKDTKNDETTPILGLQRNPAPESGRRYSAGDILTYSPLAEMSKSKRNPFPPSIDSESIAESATPLKPPYVIGEKVDLSIVI